MVTRRGEGDDAATGDYFYHTHDHLPPSPWLRRDWRGSTRNVYAQNKDQLAEFLYTPYGRELFATNRALTTRGFTGHAREAAMGGAYYAPFRYYMPSLARWEKRDPLGMVDGPNVYAYVRGNPTAHIDILGLATKEQCAFMKRLRNCAFLFGTRQCSFLFSNTTFTLLLPDIGIRPGNLIDDQGFPTALGNMDLDWFMEINRFAYPVIPLFAKNTRRLTTPDLFVRMKKTWNWLRRSFGYPEDEIAEPWEDVKERLAVYATQENSKFSDLFPNWFIEQECRQHYCN